MQGTTIFNSLLNLDPTSEVARGRKWKKCDFVHFLLMRPPRLLRSEINQISVARFARVFIFGFMYLGLKIVFLLK